MIMHHRIQTHARTTLWSVLLNLALLASLAGVNATYAEEVPAPDENGLIYTTPPSMFQRLSCWMSVYKSLVRLERHRIKEPLATPEVPCGVQINSQY